MYVGCVFVDVCVCVRGGVTLNERVLFKGVWVRLSFELMGWGLGEVPSNINSTKRGS